jgi:ribosomal protein L16 Arg81 hydroxylase
MVMNDAGFDLDWLLSPIDRDVFTTSYWSLQPLRIDRAVSNYYEHLLGESELDFILRAAAKVPGAVDQLRNDEKSMPCNGYPHALAAYDSGRSLRVNAIQRFSKGLQILSSSLEQALSCPVNINMYLSPGGSQALDRHYDKHDVFVAQISGRKKWRTFGSPVSYPLEYLPPLACEPHRSSMPTRLRDSRAGNTRPQDIALLEEFIMERGNLLYLPRGWWHEAEAVQGGTSIHLTIGPQHFTYLDLLTVALGQSAVCNPNLRKSLPIGFATHSDERNNVRENVKELIQTLVCNLDIDAALTETAETFLRSRGPGARSILDNDSDGSEPISLESRIRLRDEILCRVFVDDTTASIRFGNTIVSLPREFEEAYRFIARTGSFTVAEIPGDLSDEEKISLVERLISDGLIRVKKDDSAACSEAGDKPYWLPVLLNTRAVEGPTIKWMDFGKRGLEEPFFYQSVSRLKTIGANSKITGLEALTVIVKEVEPSGFIFQISRCGSTLLSNALRTIPGSIVVSEAQPVNAGLLENYSESEAGEKTSRFMPIAPQELLADIIRAFGARRQKSDSSLVFKFSSWNIMYLDLIRRLWPRVPCLVVIRKPVEVMVSCLNRQPGWMRIKDNPRKVRQIFGWSGMNCSAMSQEEFCARGLESYLTKVSAHCSDGLKVVDYSSLNEDCICDIAHLFGMEGIDHDAIRRTLSLYSKHSENHAAFIPDHNRKRATATDLMRSECCARVDKLYNWLLGRQLI